MLRRFNLRFAVWFVLVLFLVAAITAIAAGNSVPSSRMTRQTQAINANALKPSACGALNLTTILICPSAGGTCSGTNAAELILGSANVDNINGSGGDDCILGGGGNDSLAGGQGTDVCIGGPGTDSFNNSCETQVQ